MLPTERQQKILDLLQGRGTISIQELGGLFDVSDMTIHRDLDRLAAAGQLRKVRGGAVLMDSPAAAPLVDTDDGDACYACHSPINPRTQMVLHLHDGTQRRACCAHCGLLGVARLGEQVELALVTDFLHGRKVSAQTAVYVFDPALAVCCTPTTLAFMRQEEAERFCAGFGGQVLDLAGAVTAVQTAMRLGGHMMHGEASHG